MGGSSRWDNPTFLNAFPIVVYDESSATKVRRGFTFCLPVALALYAFYLITNEQGESTTAAFAPSSVYAKHKNSILLGQAGAVVDTMWDTPIPTDAHSWPGIQSKQSLPEVPVLFKIYGSLAKHATVTQSINYYSRCEGVLADAFPNLDLPNLPLGEGTNEGFKASIVTHLGSGVTTATFNINRDGASQQEVAAEQAWPGSSLVTVGAGFGTSQCDQCDDSLTGGVECGSCYIAVRTKLCGMSMPETIAAGGQDDDSVRVTLPLENVTSPLWVSMEMLTPKKWAAPGESNCGGCHEIYSPSHFSVAPYQRSIATASLTVRTDSTGTPVFGGYILDAIGEVIWSRLSPTKATDMLASSTPSDRKSWGVYGTELRVVLASITVTETKRINVGQLLGVVGGVSSIFILVFKVLATIVESTCVPRKKAKPTTPPVKSAVEEESTVAEAPSAAKV